MKTKVTNLLSNHSEIYVNELSLTDNIINSIILSKNCNGQILNPDFRDKIKKDYPIVESYSTITGRRFAYCLTMDLHAKFI